MEAKWGKTSLADSEAAGAERRLRVKKEGSDIYDSLI